VKNKYKIKSNIIGLDIGLVFGRFFLDTEDLHFGYWPDGEKPTSRNFAWAQENYSKLIIDKIPIGVKRILDVGSGSGNLALKLLKAGHRVDCVIPSEYLAVAVQEKLNGRGKTHICKFEDLSCPERYDVIIFSESFQYVNMVASLEKVEKMLIPDGHLLICDFFKLDIRMKSNMGGGHRWTAFQEAMENTALTQISDDDITDGTAPTVDFLNQFCQEVLKPVGAMTGNYMLSNYPKITQILMWKFKGRLDKIKRRYLSGDVNGESFKKFKSYRLLLYKNS
jgi:cyclopropane fatty-acyl-phospholipid synthase-like methyltransferase